MSGGPSGALISLRDDIGLRFDAIDLESIRMGYVGALIAPFIEAPRKSGKFTKRTLEQMLQKTPDTRRTARGAFNRVEQFFGEDTYSVEPNGLEYPLDHDNEAEWQELIDLEDIGVEATRHGVLEAYEQNVMNVVNAQAVDVTLDAGQMWDNDAADVIQHFAKLVFMFRMQTGFKPTSLLVDTAVVDQLMQNPSVVEKIVPAGNNTAETLAVINSNQQTRLNALATAFGIDEVIAADSIKNTVEYPLPASLSTMFPIAKAVLFKKSTAPTTREPQWLRTIHWSGTGSRPGCAFDQYEEPQTMATVFRHRMDYQIKVVNAECAIVVDNVVDPAALLELNPA